VTIIGYAVTSDFSIQVADRLLSVNRKPHDPNAIKTTILDYEGNLLQVGFSGLAKTGTFDAQRWILDTLVNYKKTREPLVELLDYFAGQADDEFQNINCPDKRFAVVLNGRLLDLKGQYHPDVAIISNGIDFCAYAQNPSDMFGHLSEGSDDNAQIPICSHPEPLSIVFNGSSTGG